MDQPLSLSLTALLICIDQLFLVQSDAHKHICKNSHYHNKIPRVNKVTAVKATKMYGEKAPAVR